MDRLLTVREVAERLGTWNTSKERFVRRLIEERRIEFIHIGRNVRIRESIVQAYIEANTVPAVSRGTRRLGVAA